MDPTKVLVDKLTSVVINPLLALLFGIALVVFVWGVVEFLAGLSAGVGTGKERGKMHMIYGVVGMFIMASAWAILKLISNTVNGLLGGS